MAWDDVVLVPCPIIQCTCNAAHHAHGHQAASGDIKHLGSASRLKRTPAPPPPFSTPAGLYVGHDLKFPLLSQMIKENGLLKSAKLVQVDRHCTRTPVPHRFLVVHLQCKDEPYKLFLRLDRRPDLSVSPLGFSSRLGVTGANDTASLSGLAVRAPDLMYFAPNRHDLRY